MKLGLVGYQGSGKSTLFELLTAVKPDPAKAHLGQLGTAVVPDARFDRLVSLFKPKKTSPARIELFDTPGLDRKAQDVNGQRLGVIRESNALVLVVGCFAGANPVADVRSFQDDIILADLQVVTNRMSRLQKDVAKPRPDREQLQAESAALEPIAARLNEGRSVADMIFTDAQDKATKSFSLLTRKKQLVILNTADSTQAAEVIGPLEAAGHPVVSAPIGLELEVQQLPPEDRETFAHEMGLGEPFTTRFCGRFSRSRNKSPSIRLTKKRSTPGFCTAEEPRSMPPARSTPTSPGALFGPKSPRWRTCCDSARSAK